MSDEVKKPPHLHSQTLKVKPTCHFSARVQKVKECLLEYKYDVTYGLLASLQDSMNLEKTFQDVLLEYDVEVVSVNEDVEGTLNYLKKKSDVNANVVACVRLEVETRDRNLWISKNNDHLLEQDYPCEIIFEIQEASDTSEENAAEKFSEFQPVTITKQRSEIVNDWLDRYQVAIESIITACKNTIKIHEIVENVTDHVLVNLSNQETIEISLKRRIKEARKCQPSLQQQFPDATFDVIMKIIIIMVENIWISIERYTKELLYIKQRFFRELYQSIVKIIKGRYKQACFRREYNGVTCRLLQIFRQNDEEMKAELNLSIQGLHRYIIFALEKEIEIVQNQKFPVSNDLRLLRPHCQLTSFCSGLLDSTRGSIGFGFRAESFDRIHVSISRSIDASIDRKTIREATQETRTVDEYIEENNLKMTREDRKRLFKLVNKYSEELMEKHSNLNRISVSPVLSHRQGLFVETPCIVIYCSCKGIRPYDDQVFPKQIENVPVDVREGYCSLFGVSEAKHYNDPLRTGISIGSSGIKDSGTLGPFVVEAENKTSVGCLTCQHVFQSAEIGRNVVQPSVMHYKAETNPDTTICGKIRSMCLEDVVFNGKPTSVDVAYIVLDKRIPADFKFPDIPESMITEDFYGNPRMGQPTIHLEEDNNDIRVYKLGQTSGLTEGLFDTMRDIVVLGKERVRNVYQVSSDNMFAAHGDSGSSVFTVNGNTLSVIGLLLGGSENKKECYVIPIGAVLQALEPKLEIHQLRESTTTGAEGSDDDPQSAGVSGSLSGAKAGRIHGQSSSDKYPYLSQSVNTFSSKK